MIALWFGESDLVTPPFIREAAKRALEEEGDLWDCWEPGRPPGSTEYAWGSE